ncbi:MAG: rod-binding protein [Campylobacter sp.]|nr:rod-binding protein [Campylobacter sp.]MDY4859546.1 rod-binding protein [Campylobacter sp.]
MMIDNTLAINAYSASKIDALKPRNAYAVNSSLDFARNSSFASELDLALEKSTKPSAEFKAGFKEQKELVNGIDTKALREQTDAFESFFVKMVLDIAIKTENPLFGKDAGDEIYGSMYRQTMSEALSGGFGFSDMIYDYLLERAK